jgi:hypothetical protein
MTAHDRDLSTEARSAKVDDAIDRVAARMTAIRDDEAMTERIVASLPERRMFGSWLLQAWAPRLAVVALIVIGAALWNRNGIERPDPARAPRPSIEPALVAFAPVVVPNRPINSIREPLNLSEPLEPVEPLEPLEPDFERSLPALAAMTTLSFEPLLPRELPASRDISPAPIEIVDLPSPGEPFSPR